MRRAGGTHSSCSSRWTERRIPAVSTCWDSSERAYTTASPLSGMSETATEGRRRTSRFTPLAPRHDKANQYWMSSTVRSRGGRVRASWDDRSSVRAVRRTRIPTPCAARSRSAPKRAQAALEHAPKRPACDAGCGPVVERRRACVEAHRRRACPSQRALRSGPWLRRRRTALAPPRKYPLGCETRRELASPRSLPVRFLIDFELARH